MSRFVNGTIERMELDGGDWVELRTQFGYGARQAVVGKTLGSLAPQLADRKEGDPMPRGSLDLEAGNVELLVRAIVRWGGPGFCAWLEHPHEGDCLPREVTVENIAMLDQTGDEILAWLEPRLKRPTPDFTKPSSQHSPMAGTAGRTRRG